ncbi:MAG: DUF3788 domain-containing protein [Armatimonadota bacterium]
MTESNARMIDKNSQPDDTSLVDWLGEENYARWTHITRFIETNYPGIFEPEWLFGGKHGWSLRYKKSKSFCTLIPEKNRLLIQIVFGGSEREKTETILPELVSHAREDYVSATTYHDGKWLALVVDSNLVLSDVERLLIIKRKPRI